MSKINLKQKKAFTIIELLVAVFLLGLVVLTGVSVEMAVRRMQNKPTVKALLLDELTPVLEKINKDYNTAVGYWNDSGVYIESGNRGLEIRVDSGGLYGQVDPFDNWHAYRWHSSNNTIASYYSNTSFDQTLTFNVGNFSVTSPSNNPNDSITIRMSSRLDYTQPVDPFDNPEVNITSTLYSRGISIK